MSFTFRAGSIPLLVSIPHNGFAIPDQIAKTMTADGRSSRDTDWFLDRLYDFPEMSEASLIVAGLSRYVIDLNRPADNQSLYPGQTTTGLIPETCFDGAPVYSNGLPDADETTRRINEIWQPYHQQISAELERLVSRHGIAVLLDAHSIASEVPRLFDGVLPDFNLGTNYGKSCSEQLSAIVLNVLEEQNRYSHVLNGRFVGGYITRHFGQPDQNIHGLQIELAQSTYMNEKDLSWNDERASAVQPVFHQIVSAIRQWISQK